MKSFSLNEHGDVEIEKKDIRLAEGSELLAQKLRQVLRTNRGEWWKNAKEGIPIQKMLKKDPNHAQIKDYIRVALRQVAPKLSIKTCQITEEGRRLHIHIEITGAGDAETIQLEV